MPVPSPAGSTMNVSRFACWLLGIGLLLTASPVQAQQDPAGATKTRTLGVLLFPGFELLDAYGPLEMWGNLKGQVRVVTVARQKGEVASAQGPKTVAEHGFDDCP